MNKIAIEYITNNIDMLINLFVKKRFNKQDVEDAVSNLLEKLLTGDLYIEHPNAYVTTALLHTLINVNRTNRKRLVYQTNEQFNSIADNDNHSQLHEEFQHFQYRMNRVMEAANYLPVKQREAFLYKLKHGTFNPKENYDTEKGRFFLAMKSIQQYLITGIKPKESNRVSPENVREIRKLVRSKKYSKKECAKLFSISYDTVNRIMKQG